MNNTFDFRRFGLYARKEFRENWKAYALGFVGMVAILVYYIYAEWTYIHNPYFVKNYIKDYTIDIKSSLTIAIGPTVWIAGSYILKAFSNRQRTFTTLLLPVSLFEQFLYAFTVSIFLSMFICFVFWKIAWAISLPYFSADFPNLKIINDSKYWTSNPYFSVFLLGGNAAFMCGAVALGRLNFLKTLGILIAVGVLVFYWGQGEFLETLFPNVYEIRMPTPAPWVPQKITIQSSEGIFSNDIHSTFENIYGFWWVLCVPLLLYAITFLKIKEKEI
jgi:hypothetical protein